MTDVPADVQTTLLLSGGEAVGSAGCNNYFGSYEIDATSLTFPDTFGTTRMLCEGAAQEVEDAYLPLLATTAAWAVADGSMSLSDADGTEILVYADAPVEVTSSDVAALIALLSDLQTQIDDATAEIAGLNETIDSFPANKVDKRITAVEDSVTALEKQTKGLNVDNIKKRLKAAEAAITDLDKQMSNVKKRVKDLETVAKDHEARLEALEEQVPIPTPS